MALLRDAPHIKFALTIHFFIYYCEILLFYFIFGCKFVYVIK